MNSIPNVRGKRHLASISTKRFPCPTVFMSYDPNRVSQPLVINTRDTHNYQNYRLPGNK